MTTLGAVRLVPVEYVRTLTLQAGPSVVVEVVRECTPGALQMWHVTRRSVWGGPTALVAGNLTREADAVEIARREAGR